MLGLWSKTYEQMIPHRYGGDETYLCAESYLKGLDVEDWGCGEGRFKDFHNGVYIGIDGSKANPRCHIVADLRKRRSYSPGILLRHVLEHNIDWQVILKNAVKCATNTLVVVLFTPFQQTTKQIGWSDEIKVPDIGFALEDIRALLPKVFEEHTNIPSPSTQYGVEHVFVVMK